jgi:hypothetical protein
LQKNPRFFNFYFFLKKITRGIARVSKLVYYVARGFVAETLLYHIPTQRFEELTGLKNPSLKVLLVETI